MALRIYGLDELIDQIRAYFRAQFPGKDHSNKGYFGLLSVALAMVLLEVQARLYQLDANWPPTGPGVGGDALRQTETDVLDRIAVLLGLPTNQPTAVRPYGRNLATFATGGTGLLSAPANTVFATGLILTDPTGVLVQLDGAAVVPNNRTTVGGFFKAVTAGAAGNLASGTPLTFQAPPPGAAAQVTLVNPLVGGGGQESDESLLLRIYDRLQNPPGAGKASDYRTWARIAGILRVYVYPKRGGTGTVHTVLTQAGQGTGRAPTNATLASSLAAVTAIRPVTVAGYRTFAPFFDSNRVLQVRLRMQPLLAAFFDWTDGPMDGLKIKAWQTGPNIATVTGSLAALGPSLLQAVADAQAGVREYPRIQVLSTAPGAPVVPLQVRVKAATDGGAQSALVLDELPLGFVDPRVADANVGFLGDAIFAGGIAPPIIAEAARALIDSLGPARGRYADPDDLWEDTLTQSALVQAAMDATSSGTRLARTVAPLIKLGAGAMIAQDVQARDILAGAPEALYARLVVATL